MKKPETKFKEKVLAKLKLLGPDVWFLKTQEVSRRGTPDIIICAAGQFFAWELKVDSKVDALQEYNLTRIRNSGGYGAIVTPADLELNLTFIKEVINERR